MPTQLPTHLMGPGSVIQVVRAELNSMFTTTTIIPNDDTIPQITEGAEWLTATITPKSATSRLIISASASMHGAIANGVEVIALFRDSTANSFASNFVNVNTTNVLFLSVSGELVASSTSPTTIHARCGRDTAERITINGLGAARYYGGSSIANITITEVAA